MAVNAFLTFFDKAAGESIQKGKKGWVELRGWQWQIDAETAWTKGGGASVGKPEPGSMTWQHSFDTSSATIMGYICSGKAFPKVEIQMVRPAGTGAAATFLTVLMEGVYVTRVSNVASDEGDVLQSVEMVFKTIRIEYALQDPKTGKVGRVSTFNWDIPAGTASPSS